LELTMNDFLLELLSLEGMTDGLKAVQAAFDWWTHASARRDFEDIKANGLQPRWPDGGITPDELVAARGYGGRDIVCLSPYPKTRTMLLSKGDWLFRMAVKSGDLPGLVGIDCTFGGAYQDAAGLRGKYPDMSRGEIFLRVVRETEVLVIFERIAPEFLRVCPKAAPNAPFSEWPRVEGVEIGDVELFGPPDPIMGYVPV
jgi:hypothetical protein